MSDSHATFLAPRPNSENRRGAYYRPSLVKHFAILMAMGMLAIGVLPGCRICADCEDLDYPAYGGSWQRTIRDHGRVGSVFDPAGGKAPDLVDRDTPEQPDVIERNRQSGQDSERGRTGDPDSLDDELGPGEDVPPSPSDMESEEDLRNRQLDDIESDLEDELRGRTLEDIKVRIIPGRDPVMIKTE